MTRRARAAACLGWAVVALALGGCGDSTGSSTPTTADAGPAASGFGSVEQAYTGSGPKVVVLGDSIMVATAPDLRLALPDHSLKIAAVRGEGLSGGPLSAAVEGGDMSEVAESYAKDRPEVAVLELGTNDAWHPELTLGAAVEAIEKIDTSLDGSCLVVVNVTERSEADGYDRDEARAINDHLADIADEVVDWDAMGAKGSNTGVDGIHPTPEGAQVLARSIADAVERCQG